MDEGLFLPKGVPTEDAEGYPVTLYSFAPLQLWVISEK